MISKNKNFLIVGLGLMGGSYAERLSEKSYKVFALDVNKESIEITLTKQDNTAKVYTKNVTVENKTTLVHIYKIDKHSKEQLTGAKFALYDDKGNEVTSWVSDGTPYIIEGLSIDKKYELKELEAPNGYHLLDDVFKFNVGNSEETKEIKVENEKIKVQKQKVLPKTGF